MRICVGASVCVKGKSAAGVWAERKKELRHYDNHVMMWVLAFRIVFHLQLALPKHRASAISSTLCVRTLDFLVFSAVSEDACGVECWFALFLFCSLYAIRPLSHCDLFCYANSNPPPATSCPIHIFACVACMCLQSQRVSLSLSGFLSRLMKYFSTKRAHIVHSIYGIITHIHAFAQCTRTHWSEEIQGKNAIDKYFNS